MLAEVISIGDELTSGQNLDTNSQWLSQQLSDLGIVVRTHQTIGDYLEPMQDAFQAAFQRSDLVIVTGGLGPTQDDLTRQALANAFNSPLRFDESSWQVIQGMFSRRGIPVPESNRLQAFFPEESSPIHNPHGTAPGIFWQVQKQGRSVSFYCLPGVPSEMREMFAQSIRPELQARSQSIVVRKVIKTFGAGESHVEGLLPDLIKRGNDPQVGITASQATISLRLQTVANTMAAGQAKIDPIVSTIQDCLGELVFGYDDEELEDVVVRKLEQHPFSLALVEWGTHGNVSQRLDEAYSRVTSLRLSGSSFQGAVVLTHEAAVRRWLEPDVTLAPLAFTDVPAVIRELADVVALRFQANLTVACGPLPVANSTTDLGKNSPAAQFHLISRLERGETVQYQPQTFSVVGHRSLWRPRATKQMLNHLRLLLNSVDSFDADVR